MSAARLADSSRVLETGRKVELHYSILAFAWRIRRSHSRAPFGV